MVWLVQYCLLLHAYLFLRRGLPAEDISRSNEENPNHPNDFFGFQRISGLLAAIFFGSFAKLAGALLVEPLGIFGFLGNALFLLGDITIMLAPAIIAVAVGGVFANIVGKFGQSLNDNLSSSSLKVANLIFTSLAGAVLFALDNGWHKLVLSV